MNSTPSPIPHSIEAERIVLGAMMLDAGIAKRYGSEMSADMFWYSPHGIVFDVIRDMIGQNKPSEPTLVTMELHKRGQLEQVGGAPYVTELFCSTPTTATADHYRNEVETHHARRLVLDTAAEAMRRATAPDADPVRIADDMRSAFSGILSLSSRDARRDIAPLSRYEAIYRDFAMRVEERAFPLRKWLPGLSRAGKTLVPGELVAIVADTGVGKTAIASSLALAARPLKVAYFQLELPSTLAYPRFLQSVYGKTLGEVYDMHKTSPDEAWGTHGDLSHLWLSVRSGLSIEKIRQRVEAMNAISDEPFGMVIVDYMQLLRGNGKTRYERYSNEAEEAKVAAKETDSIWVVLSQVGRPDGAAETYEPGLHDAKESGSIENSAGLVLGISRCDDTHGEALKVRVLKSTKGGAGTTVVANWNVQTLKITERYDGDIIP